MCKSSVNGTSYYVPKSGKTITGNNPPDALHVQYADRSKISMDQKILIIPS